MRNIIILFISIIIISCGKDSSSEELKKAKIEIRLAYHKPVKADDVVMKIANSFMEENPDIVISTTSSNWDGHYDRLRAEIAAGEEPEVYLLDGVYVSQYADRGLIEDLTDRASTINEEDYIGIKELKDNNGKLFAIPQGIQVDVLYYNKDIFDSHGVSYPTDEWTLFDLESAAIKLTTDDYFGFSLPANHIRYSWYPIIRQFGGDILDNERRNSTIKSDPYVKEAIEFIYNQWNKYKTVPNFSHSAILGKNSSTYFPRSKVAMYYDAYVAVSRIPDSINYDVVVQPFVRERYASFIANSWVINKRAASNEKEAGWKFIKYYLSEKSQTTHSINSGTLPAKRSVLEIVLKENITKPVNSEAFIKTLDFAGTLAKSPVWSKQNKAFEAALIELLRDQIGIDEFISKADHDVQKVLDDYYKEE